MASLKAIRKRISSVKSTQQITKAMKMVSAAKLRRAQDAATQARPYSEKLAGLLAAVSQRAGSVSHPLLATPPTIKSVDLIVVTADRGLCGGYNTNLIRKAEGFLRDHQEARVRLTMVGRKGYDYFKKRPVELASHHIGLGPGPGHELAVELAARFAQSFAAGETDAVFVLYSKFQSALSQVPTVAPLLPLSRDEVTGNADLTEYIYEPTAAELLDRLLRQYVVTVIDHAFLESIASEHGARMTAMDSATANARDMIDRLTLAMNRARQAVITTELMEIVSGAEALKG